MSEPEIAAVEGPKATEIAQQIRRDVAQYNESKAGPGRQRALALSLTNERGEAEAIEQALINLREAIARNPVNVETRLYLAAALVAAGDQRAAEWEAEEIRTQEPGFSMRNWLVTYPLTGTRERARLLELLARVGL